MTDASIIFLLNTTKELIRDYVNVVKEVKPQLEELKEDLHILQAFLIKSTTKKWREDESRRVMIRQIRDVVYEAEDVFDAFYVTLASDSKREALKKHGKLYAIATDVKKVMDKVQKIYGDRSRMEFALKNDPDPVLPDDQQIEAPFVRKENIVGFKDEERKFIGYLKEETDQLDVVSIIGMPGLGKTTLAGMIFRNSDIVYEFPTRIWVYVTQDFKLKRVLLAILKEVTSVTDDIINKTVSQLAELVSEHLKTGKFLIVMDDVWTAEDWKELRATLPMSDGNGKILITSRQIEVGNAANPNRAPHQLRFLTHEESWELLRLEVFHKRESPPELEKYGESILKKCDGLPLAIVVIGGILSKRVSATDVNAMITMWRKVSENVNKHIDTVDKTKRMEKIIALSYDKLPYYLKACFLYLGMFPEDFEIPTWKLTRMWIGEGFIEQKNNISLEESAENNLDDLINRNLLRVDKRRRNGKVKTCRIHDMIRDFCITEAGFERENFLQEIKTSSEGPFDPPVVDIVKFRRICIHYNVVDFLSSSNLQGPKVRSFVYFSKEEIVLPLDKTSVIPASFKRLKVLEIQPIKFSRVPKRIDDLSHLRFISILLNLNYLPKNFSKLWNIQTLIVNTKERTLDIKADIWKMKQLRHFKTNASSNLHKPEKSSVPSENIKTLGTISPESCTESVFDTVRYVKNLSIRGRLAVLLKAKNESSDKMGNLGKLAYLEMLKLKNDAFPLATSENPLPNLPPANRFPPSLRKLTLADTYLEWSQMSILGQIENLEVLKLLDSAFVGETWEAIDNHFSKLEVLFISRTDLKTWIANQHHFPKLRGLELAYCDKLSEIPEELANIPSFQMLTIHRCACAATLKAKFSDNKKFELSIFPPLEKTST